MMEDEGLAGGKKCNKVNVNNLLSVSSVNTDMFKIPNDTVLSMELQELLTKETPVNSNNSVNANGSSTDGKELNGPRYKMAYGSDDREARSPCCCRCSRERNLVKNRRSSSSESISATNVTDIDVNSPSDSLQCGGQERLKEESIYRTRLKSSARLHTDRRDNRIILTKSFSYKVKTVLRTKKIMCQFVVLFIVLLSGGVFMLNHSPDKRPNNQMLDPAKQHATGLTFQDYIDSSDSIHQDSGDNRIIMDMPFREVRREDFERHALQSKSSADMMRIFFDDSSLTDDQVNTILQMKANPHLYSIDKAPRDMELASDSSYQIDAESVRQNLMETATNSICRDPKPEVHRVENMDASAIRHYIPACTILHRCRKTSGCCMAHEECGPKKDAIEIITKNFLVVEVVYSQTFGEMLRPTNRQYFEEKTFINHTACECSKIQAEETNCHKKCPGQFMRRRTEVDCICVCHGSNHKCQRMFHGRIPIEEEDLECIKKGDCLEPECADDMEFKLANGFCTETTHKRRHRHGRQKG